MVFRFLILSDEVDNFRREIKIDADNTFFDLYKAIIESVGYSDKEVASFFICDKSWRKEKEITLVEMDTSYEEDSYIMEESILSDFLEDEKQKLMLSYDFLNERSFYMELAEITTGKELKKPICVVSEGEAPVQVKTDIDTKTELLITDLDESFYGDESFDYEELDREGFDGLDDEILNIDETDLL